MAICIQEDALVDVPQGITEKQLLKMLQFSNHYIIQMWRKSKNPIALFVAIQIATSVWEALQTNAFPAKKIIIC
jgi:hypothetical protein